ALRLQPINDPIPAVRRLEHHLRLRAGVRDNGRDRQRIIRHTNRRKLLARRVLANDHGTSTMKVDPDILSIHRGLPSSEEDMLLVKPRVSTDSDLTRSGGPAPSSHQLWGSPVASVGRVWALHAGGEWARSCQGRPRESERLRPLTRPQQTCDVATGRRIA